MLQKLNKTKAITRTCNENESKLETPMEFGSDKLYINIKMNIEDLE